MRDLLEEIDAWRRAGKRVVLARVVDVEGSAPLPPGAALAVNDDGQVAGSVSGGCVDPAVVSVAAEVLAGGERRVVTFGFSDADGLEVGLTCGGTLRVFVEPLDW